MTVTTKKRYFRKSAPREYSDQPASPKSLIRTVTVRLEDSKFIVSSEDENLPA